MSLILSGTDGLSDVDGSAATPAIRGTDANTGIFFPAADTIAFAEGGAEVARFDSSGNFGLGTATPSFPSGTGLAIYNASAPRLKFTNSTTGDASTDGTQLLVSGSDFYIQQREAASVFISTNGTNAVTVDSGGGFKVLNTIGVGNATPSTSGAGITFPATQSASSDANTLDDYEEGTWTPTAAGTGTPGTYTVSVTSATYTKIGRLVNARFSIGFSAASGGTGTFVISGLPFNYSAVATIIGSLNAGSLNTTASSSNGIIIGNLSGSSDTRLFFALVIDNAANEEIACGAVSTATTVAANFSYQV